MDSGIRCRRCGKELKPADAEAADGRALSESDRLVHQEGTGCATRRPVDSETLETMLDLERDGLFEVRFDENARGDRRRRTQRSPRTSRGSAARAAGQRGETQC